MALYYDLVRVTTTNAVPVTCSTHVRLLTVAGQTVARLMQMLVANRGGTLLAGGNTCGGEMRIGTLSASTFGGGTAQTLQPRMAGGIAAQTTATNDASSFTYTGGATTYRLSLGFPISGPQAQWTAIDPDDAFALPAGGGVNGSLTFDSFANGYAVPITLTLDVSERVSVTNANRPSGIPPVTTLGSPVTD